MPSPCHSSKARIPSRRFIAGSKSSYTPPQYDVVDLGTDQGKTSNLNALALMAAKRGLDLPKVGTTTFRPPYTPATIGALAGRTVGPHFQPIRRSAMHDWHKDHGGVMMEAGLWLRPLWFNTHGDTLSAAYKAEMKATNLNDRILTEPETQRLLSSLTNPRDRILLRLAYATAFRVSELVSMRWRDLHDRDGGGGQITVLGKGSKFRSSLVRPAVWDEVRALARLDRTSRSAIPTFLADGSLNPDAPVFRSRNGVPLGIKQVWRIVRRAAIEAGLTANVSPHWLRHAHASHALDRGAPIHLVRDSLGHSSIATTNRYLHARPTEHSERFLAL